MQHFRYLGDRDPLAVLGDTPDALEDLLRGRADAALRARPAAGGWCAVEILGHLVDHEIVSLCRAKTARFEPAAWLGRYDQDRWVAGQGYAAADPEELLARLRALRALTLEQYDALDAEELARERQREGGEPVTLAYLRSRHADHDLLHADQLRRRLGAAGT